MNEPIQRIFVSETNDDGERCGFTHYGPPLGSPGDYTLCGLDTAGDDHIGLHGGADSTERVDCSPCIAIVKYCRNIRDRFPDHDGTEKGQDQ